MADEYRPLEQHLRVYGDVVQESGREFVDRTVRTISEKIEPRDLLLVGLSDKDDRYPNYYVTILEAALQGMRYNPSVIRGVPLNGALLPKDVIKELVSGKPTVIVEVHFSPFYWLYLAELKAIGASHRLYAYATPPPSGLWELTDENELIQLRRSV